ncbi:hypothetical protein JRO89_XS11G0073000 [Xanthoceras sorbifolium]|uniref:Uncharacterized protein n=1 Tax=Xanthoceras sorbifolium TaxID=99658 RepID=A0ABQ8HEZ2_9ROSI|nr:hypothetical protein JRO89_XS11G0073000 [Xanthoceras sorbifolium]
MAVDSKNCVLCVQGATIVEQIVSITPAENYVPKLEMQEVTIVENAVSVAPAENDEMAGFGKVVELFPNATTFIVPAEIFPARLRSTCHGISAAAGKTGPWWEQLGFWLLRMLLE